MSFGYLHEPNTLKFVCMLQGKESNDIILESLEKEGFEVSESFRTFGRVSVRRLGRLLPQVPWVSLTNRYLAIFSVSRILNVYDH